MAKYANHECAGCGRILPAYELTEVSDRVETGTSRYERRIGHTQNFRHSGTSRHYANRVKRLCLRCRTTRFFGKVVTLCLAGGAFMLFADHGGHPAGGKQANGSMAGTVLDHAQGLLDQAGEAVSTAATSSSDTVQIDPSSRNEPQAETGQATAPRPSADADGLAQQIISSPETVEQVERAVQEALESGKAQRWKVHKLRGYAVPSDAASNGCRMIQVSIDHGEQGAAFQRCPAGGKGQEL